ncbi:aspartyl protease [Iningainema tapete]|uniref:Aspartyl protease n=1 Tax=Iningainema tapete BLCC-T55 TaxID=2748662 RepID=A0A8J6XFS0_9CYAN|nr:aspartyl protease [Iningainema tapete]MBD2774969.1 aspartyl protease [Iningainema tapete BLCC-T55]
MIQGTFGSRGQLFFEIELITTDGLNLPVDAMFDTGFTGFLAIHKQDLDALDWAYVGQEPLLTAQGEIFFEKYLGKVLLDGIEYEIPVFVGEAIPEVLLGSGWLKFMPLVVNYQAGILTLG